VAEPRLLEIGRITRAHGLRGEVVVDLVTDRLERLAPGTVLQTRRGDLTVLASRPHQQRWLVQFAGVADRTAADTLVGTVLLAESIDEPGTLWVHELVGARVVERDGTDRGRVVAVVDNPAHDLLELDSGALVPVVFVEHSEDGVVTIAPPAGLFD
jgi:16S rRNA processing protein RimM